MAPGPPKKGKKPKKGYFWSLGTQMAYQKNFRRFSGRGVKKYVAAHRTAPIALLNTFFLKLETAPCPKFCWKRKSLFTFS